MASFDTSVPAVLVRLDRNPFHHGTLGAVRSLGRAGITVHAVIESARSPVARSRYLHTGHPRPDNRVSDDGPRATAADERRNCTDCCCGSPSGSAPPPSSSPSTI